MPDFTPNWQMSGESTSKRWTERWTAVHRPPDVPTLRRVRARINRGSEGRCRPGLRELVQQIVQEMLEADMEEAVGAQKSERTAERVG